MSVRQKQGPAVRCLPAGRLGALGIGPSGTVWRRQGSGSGMQTQRRAGAAAADSAARVVHSLLGRGRAPVLVTGPPPHLPCSRGAQAKATGGFAPFTRVITPPRGPWTTTGDGEQCPQPRDAQGVTLASPGLRQAAGVSLQAGCHCCRGEGSTTAPGPGGSQFSG